MDECTSNENAMIVSCGLNVGKLLRVLHEGLLKEDTHVAPLMSLVGNEGSNGISLSNRDNITAFMLDLSRHCCFHSETYSLSVSLLDRLLSVVKANPKYLPCMSICCLFLAVKMSEEDEDVPTAADFVKVSGLRFTSSDLLRMERVILDKLKWNLNATTPLYFLEVFHALCVSKGFLDHCPVNQHLRHVTGVLEGLLCHHEFVFFKPSTLALALLSSELAVVCDNWLQAIHFLQQEAKIPDSKLWQCSKLVREHLNSTLLTKDHLRLRSLPITDEQGITFAAFNTKLP
ncbi:cyclin-I-like isoform X2 [Montipora capricornis]|uniref:cyclin-I-like isoform X2 n=1 Tax=Montipora capricornis TaxID=246305 RepID=UPI0035F1FAE1